MQFPRITLPQSIPWLTLGVILFCIIWLALTLFGMYRDYHEESNSLVPRIARLKGLAASEEMLRQSNENAAQVLAGLAYPAVSDIAATGTQMQQQVRAAMELAGMSVAGSQILPPQVDKMFTRIQMDVSASGSMDALEAALLSLEDLRPLVIVDSVNLQPLRPRRRGDDTQLVNVRIRLVALRLTP